MLLVDIGNTRIKWALWQSGRIGPLHAAAHAGWSRENFERRVFGGGRSRSSGRGQAARVTRAPGRMQVTRIIVASVAGAGADRRFAAAARGAAGVRPEFIATSRRAAGVTTRYREPWRLGVDRFVAAIGAHRLAGARGACVVNAGTTVTIDLVDGGGVHYGGAILPGPELMVSSLMRSTAGIERRARETAAPGRGRRSSRGASLFARSTKAAIWAGAHLAAAAAVDRAFAEARGKLGARPLLLLTGGAAGALGPLIRSRCVRVADLVLRGVAVYGGLELR
ncbi:MAG: type III pantothenate kinase [Steroidobacteraceae bacterium]